MDYTGITEIFIIIIGSFKLLLTPGDCLAYFKLLLKSCFCLLLEGESDWTQGHPSCLGVPVGLELMVFQFLAWYLKHYIKLVFFRHLVYCKPNSEV